MNRKIGFKKKLKREIAFEKENIRERERIKRDKSEMISVEIL